MSNYIVVSLKPTRGYGHQKNGGTNVTVTLEPKSKENPKKSLLKGKRSDESKKICKRSIYSSQQQIGFESGMH